MKKLLLSAAFAALLPGFASAIDWDGGAATNKWDTDTNWNTDLAPTATDNVIFNVSTGLPSFGGVDIGTASVAANVTVDIPAWALRADADGTVVKTLTIDNLTFTSNFTNNGGSGTTFTNGTNTDGLRLEFTAGNRSITNNSSNTVVFDSGTDVRGFGISSAATANVLLEGSGNFSWDRGRVFSAVERFGTGDTFTGTFTVNTGHGSADTFQMGTDLRAQGGTIDINASNVIADTTNVSLNDSVGTVDATIDFSGQTEIANVLNSFNAGGILAVNASTDLTFSNLNIGSGSIDITGWSQGASSLVFTTLGAPYSGTIAEGEAFVGLTIGGGTAYMTEIAAGEWAVTANPTVAWDGGATTNKWDTATNWDTDLAPTATDNVIFNVSTGLPGFGGVEVGPASVAANVTVNIPAWALRADAVGTTVKVLTVDNLTFTSNFTNNAGSGQTFTNGTNADGLRLEFTTGDRAITNNSANTVAFDSGVDTRGFGLSGTGGAVNVLLEGTGNFSWNRGRVFSSVPRFGTGDTYTGTFTVNTGHGTANAFQMGIDLRAQGGTIDINVSNVIADTTNVSLNDSVGPVDATIDFSGQTETANVLNSFNAGGILKVDGSTALTFSNLNTGSGNINITGWSEGNSSLVFTSLAAPYGGPIAEGEIIVGLTIAAADAYLTEVSPGVWGVTATPPVTSVAPPEFADNYSFDGGTGIASFSFPGLTGSLYVIERTFDLGAVPIVWTEVYNSGVLGADQTLTPSDNSGSPQAFYRLTITTP